MEKRRRRKHHAHARALVVCGAHRPFFAATPGGAKSVAKLERAVAAETARVADQEQARLERQAASDRVEQGRRALHDEVRHVATVSTVVPLEDGLASEFVVSGLMKNDDTLLARSEAIQAAASAHAERFVQEGVQPGLLDTLAGDIAAFKKAKDRLTLARQRFTEATEALDQALDDGDEAVAVLEGILITSPDAPVGALAALKQAKRIGPRESDEEVAEPSPAPATAPPAAAPAGKVGERSAPES